MRALSAPLAGATMLMLSLGAAAHDLPADVAVRAFVKPEGRTLQLLVRAPLGAMADVDFPMTGAGLLDLSRADGALRDAAHLWIVDNVDLYEGEVRLATPRLIEVRVSLPSDLSFGSYDSALSLLRAPPLPSGMKLHRSEPWLDAHFEYAIDSDRSKFSIRPRLARLGLRVVTVLQFLAPDAPVRAFEFEGEPGLVRLDPRWHQVARRFVEQGFRHILDGIDHLLFLLCLVIPFRRLRPLIVLVTSFTLAHSMTLMAAAFGLAPDALWFPALIETLIAASILYMALENIVGARGHWRWMIAFGFGLVHGFGFSFALRQMLQFAGAHLLTALLSFNVGVELGQLLVILMLIPLLDLAFRHVVAERIGIIVISALVAHQAWHWMIERLQQLRQFPPPTIDASFAAGVIPWLMALLGIGVALAVIDLLLRRTRWLSAAPNAAADRVDDRTTGH